MSNTASTHDTRAKGTVFGTNDHVSIPIAAVTS